MSEKKENYETEYLNDIIQQFRQKEYHVEVKPSPKQLPDFLQKFRLDFLATKSAENIVGVVKVRPVEPAVFDEIIELSKLLEPKKPEWNFFLGLKDIPVPALTLTNSPTLSFDNMYKIIENVRHLLEAQKYVEAVNIAWPVFNTILYNLALQKRKLTTEKNIEVLLERLTYFGLINQNDYLVLTTAVNIRKASLNDLPLPYDFENKLKQLPQVLHDILTEQEQLKKVG